MTLENGEGAIEKATVAQEIQRLHYFSGWLAPTMRNIGRSIRRWGERDVDRFVSYF